MAPTWSRIREIFEAALEQTPAARAEFVDRACAGDGELLAEVNSLLAAESESTTLSHFTPLDGTLGRELGSPARPPLRPGLKIGQYLLKREIASGGMGTVYEAEQSNPTRIVALKTLRADIVDDESRRRFQYEAEALARLQHPNIAQVFEAGIDGSPYFAMELIHGARSLPTFAREQRLALEQRLRLFATVCDAVHYGHQRGVIHRDLKPSNILVDERGVPRVIDYGIARVVADDATRSLSTVAGAVIGTLAYMSPEQLRSDPDALDVRTDVYSLGAVLHELVCGKPLFDLSGKTVVKAVRILMAAEPRPPSAFDPNVPRELDWIVLRAVDRERDRRYRSASELAADISRFLAHEALEAGPPSGIYRLTKFARRHRLALGALAATILALSIGLGVAWRAKNEAEGARDIASLEAARANETLAFVRTIFSAVRADTGNRDVKVKDVLDAAAKRIDVELANQPLIEATVRSMIGECYLSLDDIDSAAPHLERALAIRLERLGPTNEETLRSRVGLGNLRSRQGRREEAEHEFRLAAEGLAASAPEEVDTLVAISAHATALNLLGRYEEAESMHRRAVALAAQRFEGTQEQAMVETQFALMLSELDRTAEADQLLTRAGQRLPADDAANNDVRLRVELATAERQLASDPTTAAKDLARIHSDAERLLGEKHTITISALAVLGRAQSAAGELEPAERSLSDALALAREVSGETSLTTARCRCELAKVFAARGRSEQAETLFRDAVTEGTRGLGADDADVLEMRVSLATFLFGQQRLDEAATELRAIVDASRRALGETAPTTTSAINWLAGTLARMGRVDEAIEILRALFEACRRDLGDDHEMTGLVAGNLGGSLFQLGRFADAVSVLEHARNFYTRTVGERDPGLLGLSVDLAIAKREAGDLTGSETLLRRCLELRREALGPADPLLASTASELATTLERLGRVDEAKALLIDR